MAIVAVAGSAPAYAKTMTSRAMIVLSAKAADAKAKRDLLSILQPSGKFSQGNRVAVSGAYMRTLPHGTTMKGLCAMDELALQYGSTAAKSKPMDEPLRPRGLNVTHLYHAVSGAGYLDDKQPTDRATVLGNIGSPDCEKLRSAKTATWFEAKDAAEAVDAVNALHATMDALRAGKLDAKGCSYLLRQGETCSQAILRVARLDKIETLGHECPHAAGQSCVELFLGHEDSMALTIVFSLKNNSPTPEDIIEVTAGAYVTVT
jgi:hypothetical protein